MDKKEFDELCHVTLNGISSIRSLCNQLEKKKLELDHIIGRIAHRCGAIEDGLAVIARRKEPSKDDES